MTDKPTYVCAACGKTYEYVEDWTDEDAAKEAGEIFGAEVIATVPLDIVCDPCWRDMMGLPLKEEVN